MILAITKGIVPPDAHRSNNGAEFLIWRIFKTRHRWDGWRNEFDVVVGQATNNVIATVYLSVIHIDTSNYLPSRRVLLCESN